MLHLLGKKRLMNDPLRLFVDRFLLGMLIYISKLLRLLSRAFSLVCFFASKYLYW
jgi:hypothetical protein